MEEAQHENPRGKAELRLGWHSGALRQGKLLTVMMKTRKARGRGK